jgi:hypothetical protein
VLATPQGAGGEVWNPFLASQIATQPEPHEVSTAEKVSFVGAKTKKYGGDTSVFPLHQGFYGMPSRFEKRTSGFMNPKSKMWRSS